jgi:predicted transcriptional regulator
MPSEVLKMTTEIVVSHASMSELTPDQLVEEIKSVYNVLSSLETGEVLQASISEKAEEAGATAKPSVPLKDIVKNKYVVCLECLKKLKTLKTHLRKAHGLAPKEYYQKYDLDPKKYPLVCGNYSAARSEMAKARGFGQKGGKKKATT